MPLTTSLITGRVPMPTDAAFSAAEIVFTLSGFDTEGDATIPPANVRAALVGDELPSDFYLWQNAEGMRATYYIVTAKWVEQHRTGRVNCEARLGIIQVGDQADYTLAELLNATPVPLPDTSYWMTITQSDYDEMMDAVADAEAAQAAAEAAQAVAEGVLASIGVPTLASGDERKRLQVKADLTGYEFTPRRKHLILAHSQSNFSRTGTFAGVWPKNLFVWNGGISGATGTAFEQAAADLPTTIRLPMQYAAKHAEDHPDTDVYLVICASPGVGIRAVVGMDYLWDTGLSGDPGAGCIGFNHGTMGSVTQVRYSETDADGYVRFIGGADLGQSLTTPARVAVAGNPAIYAEFTISSDETDSGTYRTQTVAVTASASWPPADNTPVIVYPATDRLRTVISVNAEAALTALGLTGDARKFDEALIWPTEADINFEPAYFGRDHGDLLAYLATWTDARTQYVYTLPWPYNTAAPAAIRRWHYFLEEIVARRPGNAVLVDLRATAQSDWETATDYIHVDTAADMERVGALIYAAAARGGVHLPRYEGGEWTPTVIGITNIDSVTWTSGHYQRFGRYVHVQGRVSVDPTTAAATASQIAITLPIASDFRLVNDEIGVGISATGAYGCRLTADTANDRLLLDFPAESTGSYTLWFLGSYKLD